MDENTTPSLSVYVTGATTGLGRAVTRQLVARGHRVAGTANSLAESAMIREDGGLPVYNDLFRASEVASTLRLTNAQVIVNAAPQAINSLVLGSLDWDECRRQLIDGAAALAEAAAQVGAQFIVHTSFAFLYGDTHGAQADESGRVQSEDVLFTAAVRAERTILRGQVPACVLRAGYNYGPENETLQALQQQLVSGSAVSVGENMASWVHTTDLASAIVEAVERQPAGEIFNIADDQPISPVEFVDHLADSLGVSRPGKRQMPENLRQLALHPSYRALQDTSFRVSAAKARDQLGWTPQYPTVQGGIDQTLLVWRAKTTI